jgi:hypothetical protein
LEHLLREDEYGIRVQHVPVSGKKTFYYHKIRLVFYVNYVYVHIMEQITSQDIAAHNLAKEIELIILAMHKTTTLYDFLDAMPWRI